MITRSGSATGGTAITVEGASFTIGCDMGHSETPMDAGRIQRRRGDTEMPTETRAHKPECSCECEFVAESNSWSVPIDQSISNDKQVVCYSPDWGSRLAARTTTFSLHDKLKDSHVSQAKGAEALDFEFTAEGCLNMSRSEGISDWGIQISLQRNRSCATCCRALTPISCSRSSSTRRRDVGPTQCNTVHSTGFESRHGVQEIG